MFERNVTRRRFLTRALAVGGAAWAVPLAVPLAGSHAPASRFPPVRVITRGPLHHWFGYYDKLQFDADNRLVLSNQVSFEHRTPQAEDVIQVGMVDTGNGDRWIELGKSRAWGWQQGCMLQWVPQSAGQVIWNDRQGPRFVSHLLDVETRRRRTLGMPVYTLSADGKFAMSLDFARLQRMRPGYGYVGLDDRFADQLAPADSGVFRVNLTSGEFGLVLSLSEISKIPHQGRRLHDVWHYFNHLLISPSSRRFIVLHRWRQQHPQTGQPTGGFSTRMFTANVDGSDVFMLNGTGRVSHFIWRDPDHVCMWTRPPDQPAGFYLYRDRSAEIQAVGQDVMTSDGHNSYLSTDDNRWILCDTYPDSNRMQKPYLLDLRRGRRHWLGEFHLPPTYRGEWRCDTHPRASNDGRWVCIDAPHGDQGRQLHLIDISGIVRS